MRKALLCWIWKTVEKSNLKSFGQLIPFFLDKSSRIVYMLNLEPTYLVQTNGIKVFLKSHFNTWKWNVTSKEFDLIFAWCFVLKLPRCVEFSRVVNRKKKKSFFVLWQIMSSNLFWRGIVTHIHSFLERISTHFVTQGRKVNFLGGVSTKCSLLG